MIRCLLFMVFILASCAVKYPSKRYDNLILNSGFIPNADTILIKGNPEFRVYDFKDGERVANIGSGTGWFEGYMMIAHDSMEIYAQDIDRRQIKNLHHVVDKYASLDSTAATNVIHYITGTKTESRLPDDYFDKIIIRETFHHFSEKEKMLNDIYTKLRRNGRLFVYEPRTEQTAYSKACKVFIFDRKTILVYFYNGGFVLESEVELMGNPGNVPPWINIPEEHLENKWIFIFKKKDGQ